MVINNAQESLTQKTKQSDEHRQDCSVVVDRHPNESPGIPQGTSIFRDLPDFEHTPIEKSNDTPSLRIASSPAWSQDSIDHPHLHASPKHNEASMCCIYWDGSSSSSVSQISDFALDSGIIQKLRF
jgi:hypothetical protein